MYPGWPPASQLVGLAVILLFSVVFMVRTVTRVRASQTVENGSSG
jgi:hypothetical protein